MPNLSANLAGQIIHLLKEKKQTLAVAESCTGGLIMACLTEVAGASEVFLGGIVSYANEAKTALLFVPQRILDKYGAVSEQTAYFMAQGARKQLQTDFVLSITGIAGPQGGSPEKPIGLICLGLSSSTQTLTKAVKLRNLGRQQNRESACEQGLAWLFTYLSKIN